MAVRSLIPKGGVLAIRGDDFSGKQQFTLLASEFLQTRGYECWAPMLNTRTSGVRNQMVSLWEMLQHPSNGYQLYDSTWATGMKDSEIVAGVVKLIDQREQKVAVMFEDIDRGSAQRDHRLTLLADLAQGSGSPVVATSSMETQWVGSSSFKVRTLEGFTQAEIRESLYLTAELSELPTTELENALSQVFSGEGDTGKVEPELAYQILKAKGREWQLA